MTGGQIPPHAHVEVDGHDPIHPDDHGLPEHEDINLPDEGANDSGEQDDDDDDDDGIMILQRVHCPAVKHQHARHIRPHRFHKL